MALGGIENNTLVLTEVDIELSREKKEKEVEYDVYNSKGEILKQNNKNTLTTKDGQERKLIPYILY